MNIYNNVKHYFYPPKNYSEDSLVATTATLNRFSKEVLGQPVNSSDIRRAVSYATSHQPKEGGYHKIKRNKNCPYSIIFTEDGKIAIHLKKTIGAGTFKTAKLSVIIDQKQVKPAVKLTSKYGLVTDQITGEERNATESEKQIHHAIAKKEAESLRLFSSSPDSRIMKLFSEIERADKSKTIMYEEMGTHGNLADKIEAGTLTAEQQCQMTKDLISALKELKDKKIMHKDLKTENLLLDDDMRLKVCDFGLTSSLDEDWELAGSPVYIAPELLESLLDEEVIIDNGKIDLFAAGVVLDQLFSNSLYSQLTDNQERLQTEGFTYYKQMLKRQHLKRLGSESPAENLIARMIHPDPRQRLSVEAAAYFAGLLTPEDFEWVYTHSNPKIGF